MHRLFLTVAALFAAIGLSVAGVFAAEAAQPSATDDGRFNSNCPRQNAFTTEPVCMVPFPRLIAEPERFDEKYILVVGFLANWHGVPELFSGLESFKASLPLENIYVGDIPPEISASLDQGTWVVVVGKFDAKYAGQTLSIGAIWHPLNISPTRKDMHPTPPRLPPFVKPHSPTAVSPNFK